MTRRLLNLAAFAAVLLWYVILLSCGDGDRQSVPTSPPIPRPTPAPVEQAEPEAPVDESRRWTCGANAGGFTVGFHGPGSGTGRALWFGPGHRRYNVDPIEGPEAIIARGESRTFPTPEKACGGSYQVDWATKHTGSACYDFVDLPPCVEPTPEPSPSPSPTPPPCETTGIFVVDYLSHSGTYHTTIDDGTLWLQGLELRSGRRGYSFEHPPDGSSLCLWHRQELIGCAIARCDTDGWRGRVHFECVCR